MDTCRICHFEVPLDDTAVESRTGRTICLSCYERLTNTERPMPRRLRLQIETCIAEAEAAS